MSDLQLPIALALFFLGAIVAFIFSLRILISAFEQSLLWGIAYLLIPGAAIIYTIRFWQKIRSPFVGQLIGSGIAVGGICLAPPGEKMKYPGEAYMMDAKKTATVVKKANHPEDATRSSADAKERARQLYSRLQLWHTELQAKRPGPDTTAEEKAAFEREHAEYLVLLGEYKEMAKALVSPSPAR